MKKNHVNNLKSLLKRTGVLIAIILVVATIWVNLHFLYWHPGYCLIAMILCPFVAYAYNGGKSAFNQLMCVAAVGLSVACFLCMVNNYDKCTVIMDKLVLRGKITNEQVFVDYEDRDDGQSIPAHYEKRSSFILEKGQSTLLYNVIDILFLVVWFGSPCLTFYIGKEAIARK